MADLFVHLFFPAFTRNVKAQIERRNVLQRWFRSEWESAAKTNGWRCDFLIGWPGEEATRHALVVSSGNEMVISEEPIYSDSDLVRKGTWVCESIQRVKIRCHQQLYRENSLVVLVDGSGKIDFNMANDVVKALVKNGPLILGYRKNPEETMIHDRVVVEKFENYLIETKYNVDLPDAQCGCWGFHTSLLKHLPIIAQSYDIEADILIGALAAGILPNYIPVRLIPKLDQMGNKQTDYQPEEDIRKLCFLIYRLDILPLSLPAFINDFEKKRGLYLPEAYRNAAIALTEIDSASITKKLTILDPPF